MSGFPNNLLMFGSNTLTRNYSVIAMSEVQCDYVLQLIDGWHRGEYDEIDVWEEPARNFSAVIRQTMGKAVWACCCSSGHLDADGDVILWPCSWKRWEKEMAEPQWGSFQTWKLTALIGRADYVAV